MAEPNAAASCAEGTCVSIDPCSAEAGALLFEDEAAETVLRPASAVSPEEEPVEEVAAKEASPDWLEPGDDD